MPEFLKHLLALGVASMISLSRGFGPGLASTVPSQPPGEVNTIAAANVEVSLLAGVDTTPWPAKTGVRSGIALVQSSADGSTQSDNHSSVSTPLTAPNPTTAFRTGSADKALAPQDLTSVPETACRALPTQAYGSLSTRGGASERPAAMHADLNLGQRAWRQVIAPLSLQNIGGPTDGNAPRFSSLFAPSRVPRMTGAYQVYNWDFSAGRRTTPMTSPPVSLLGFGTAPGELILLPGSGYSIGDGYAALVLFAEPTRVTLKYTREDNVAVGYTLHLESICVEPRLLALYRYFNGAGRRQLPAVRNGQALGTANGPQILVGIQDSGAWMDPRSRKDWWQ